MWHEDTLASGFKCDNAISNAVTVSTILVLDEVITICTLVIICLKAYIECLYDIQDFETNTDMYKKYRTLIFYSLYIRQGQSVAVDENTFKIWTFRVRDCIHYPHVTEGELKFCYPSRKCTFFHTLTFWRRNYFLNFSTPCVQNVNNTGTKQVRIMKQTAF